MQAANGRPLSSGRRTPSPLVALIISVNMSPSCMAGKIAMIATGAVRGIKNSSKTLDIVLDPFGGSSSTLIACERLRRQCRTSELDPTKYVDVIVRRWEGITGKTATHAEDERPFSLC